MVPHCIHHNCAVAKGSLAFRTPEECPLPRNQTAAMQLILTLISRAGLRWVHYGEVPPEKVLKFVRRMMDQHAVHLPSAALTYRKQAGLPVARLVLAPYPEELPHLTNGTTRLVWPYMLIASHDLKGENMSPLWPSRVGSPDGGRFPHGPGRLNYTWRTRYVLGVRPRTSGRKAANPWVYTWYLTDWEFEKWAGILAEYARKGDAYQVHKRLAYLAEFPRFAGIRGDLRALLRLVRKHWGQHMRTAGARKRLPIPEELRELKPITRVPVWDPPRTLGDALEELAGGG